MTVACASAAYPLIGLVRVRFYADNDEALWDVWRGEFHLYARDGHQIWCKPCRQEYDRAYHARNADSRRAQVRRTGETRQFYREIAKCELVCANCHAVRSYERRGA